MGAFFIVGGLVPGGSKPCQGAGCAGLAQRDAGIGGGLVDGGGEGATSFVLRDLVDHAPVAHVLPEVSLDDPMTNGVAPKPHV